MNSLGIPRSFCVAWWPAAIGLSLVLNAYSATQVLGQIVEPSSPVRLQRTINNPDKDLSARGFGYSFGAFNDRLLVGSFGDFARVFDERGAELMVFESPHPDNARTFGDDVTHFGNTIAISDSHSDLDRTRGGALYLFDDATGELRHTIRPPSSALFASFGRTTEAVNGNLLVSESVFSGSVHVYSPADGSRLRTYINPENESGSDFGTAIEEHDGNVFISGGVFLSPPENGLESEGVVYRFDNEQTQPSLTITAPSANSSFGFSMDSIGNRLLVGAPSLLGKAYLFDSETGELLLTLENPVGASSVSSFGFGSSVAMTEDYLFVGNPGLGALPPGAGSSYVGGFHVYDAETGELLQTLGNPHPDQNDRFTAGKGGLQVIGDQLVAGSWLGGGDGQGAVYVYSIEPKPTAGDFDTDGDVDGDDADFFIGSLNQPATGALAQLDLDGDGDVTIADHNLHVTTLAVTSSGVTGALIADVNLDGRVDVLSDGFALVISLGQNVTSRSQGDLNADGLVDVINDGFILIGLLGQLNNP